MNETYTQSKSVQCLIEWLKIREASGKSFPSSVSHFEELLRESSLYPRLLSGKTAFDQRPPLSYDQPWYELLEKGYGFSYDVVEGDHFDRMVFGWDMLFINKYAWRIVKKINKEFFVTYGDGTDVFKVWYRGIDNDAWWLERTSIKKNVCKTE